MRESEIKTSRFGYVSQDFESEIESEYNTLCHRMSNVLRWIDVCQKAVCKSEYRKSSKFGNIYESVKIYASVNLAKEDWKLRYGNLS